MITDSNKNFYLYENAHPRFERAFSFFEELMAKGVENGKYVLEGTEIPEEIYVNFMSCDLKVGDMTVAESHDKYIDIQVLIEGEEIMYVPLGSLEVKEDRPEKDVKKYAPVSVEDCHRARVTADSFAVFFTGELHAPCMTDKVSAVSVRKAVIKVLA